MRNIKLWVAVVLFAIIAVGGWFGYKQYTADKAAKEAAAREASVPIQTVKVAYQTDEKTTEALLALGKESGIFTKNRIETKSVTNASNISAFLKTGEADVQITSAATVTLGYLNDQDSVWLDKLTDYPVSFGFVGRSGDKTTFKNAGVSKLGTSPQAYAEVTAPSLGIANKLNFVVAANGAPQMAMLESGKLDFVITNVYSDTLQKTIKDKGFQTLSPKDVFSTKKVPTGIFTIQKQLDTNSDALARFVKAMNEVSNYAVANQSQFKSVLQKADDSISDDMAQKVVDAFVAAKASSYKPVSSDLNDLVNVLKGWSPKNPDRDLSKFIVDKYVK